MLERLEAGVAALLRRARAGPLVESLSQARAAADSSSVGVDSWLTHFHGRQLAGIEAACAAGEPDCYARFRALDADLWALLLTQDYVAYPHIRALLPSAPEHALQRRWNGADGVKLASQGAAFYRRLCGRFAQHGSVPLEHARVLDFGCGWGRLTRMLARDVPPDRLFGCDPSETILDVCRQSRVPATLARSDFVPERIPFEGRFDLAFAFSVFTHLSETAHERCLDALHAALAPAGVLVVTVRPPAALEQTELLAPVRVPLGPEDARYLFAPHASSPSHPQYTPGEMVYGETVVTAAYVRKHWADRFELLDTDVLLADMFQVMLTLRRV